MIILTQTYRKQLSNLANTRVLQSKEELFNEYRFRLGIISDKLDSSITNAFASKEHSYNILVAKLNAISPLNTLARGYAIVQNESDKAISDIQELCVDEEINVSFVNGSIRATVNRINPKEN